MPFYEIIQKIKMYNLKSLVLIHVGAFFEAVDLDAYVLHELFGLKVIKYARNVYKIGIPASSLKKYIRQLDEKNISICVYDTIERSRDIIYLDSILDNWYLNNEDGKVCEENYEYIKIYDSKISKIYGNGINIENNEKLKIIVDLLRAEKERRCLYEYIDKQNVKYGRIDRVDVDKK